MNQNERLDYLITYLLDETNTNNDQDPKGYRKQTDAITQFDEHPRTTTHR